MRDYQPDEYWEGLLGEKYDLAGVGHPDFPAEFNRILYAQMLRSVTGMLARHHVQVAGARVLEIGAGTGFWVQLWDEHEAMTVTGLDIAEVAVRRLEEQFPEHEFRLVDIGAESPTGFGTYDLVSAMSVLLHIVDQERFRTAVGNLASLLSDDGSIVLMEPLVRHQWFGPEVGATANSRARAETEWKAVLAEHDLQLVDTSPVTALLGNVCDTRYRATWRLHQLWWNGLRLLLARTPAFGIWVTRAAAVVDRALVARRVGPSAKVMLVRRARHS